MFEGNVLLKTLKNRLMFICGLWALLVSHSPYADESLWRSTATDADVAVIQLYFFWSPTCPHCQRAREYVEKLPSLHPWLNLNSYNIAADPQHVKLYQQMARGLDEDASSVPAFFICGSMYVGWDSPDGMGQALLDAAELCRSGMPARPDSSPVMLQVPLLGDVGADDYSLPLFTLIVAGMDAFNPCAFFVLLFLLSLLVHARSRARMALIGGCFVLVSGLVYFVFMSAWLNLFLLVGNLPWITLVAGLVATVIGLLGIKDFLFSLKGPSLSISDQAKPKLYGRMRGLLGGDNLPALLLGTISLALVANSYELLCTAGFPMVYTRALTLHDLSSADYYLYLILYNIIYVMPLMAIVALFTVSLGARKLTLTEGRLLKLLSGMMMFGLGLTLLLKPEWLNNVKTGVALLAIAIVSTLLARFYLRTKERDG